MNFKKILTLITAIAILGGVVTGCSSAEKSTLDAIKEKGVLVLGTEAQYAPFEFKNENAVIVGSDIWLAEQIATEIGVELEIVDMAFDGIIAAVQSSQVDIGIAAFTENEERAKAIDFSNIYQEDQQMLIVSKENAEVYTTAESLVGQTVGAQKGTIQSKLILSALPESELFELAKYPELALEVANGNIAGLVVDSSVGHGLAASNDNLAISPFEFADDEGNFGKAAVVKKGSDGLLVVVNKVIDAAVEDGSYEEKFEEYKALAATLTID